MKFNSMKIIEGGALFKCQQKRIKKLLNIFWMKMDKRSWLLLSFLLINDCDAYKILVIFPIPSKSHGILGDGFIRHLLAAGHEVTYVTPFLKKDHHPNLHQIDLSSNEKVFNAIPLNLEAIMDGKINLQDEQFLIHMMINFAKETMANENTQKLMRDTKQNFDIIVAEWMFSQLGAGFSAVFNCPYVWFSTLEPHWMILDLIDDKPNPAYNADYKNTYLPPLTFTQRVHELWIQIIGAYRYKYNYLAKEQKLFDELIAPAIAERGRPVPSYLDLIYNASMLLGNSHISLDQSKRLPQNYVAIGGFHIDTDIKPLPEDLKKIMDNAKNGVIYFSMGSNLRSNDFPTDLKQSLLKMFGGLKYTVLWKFEEILPDLPKNVHILTWAPQTSILAHPNCILFITHGGLLSTTEAIHFAVPIIGIPVFADQFRNVERAVNRGFAKKVDLSYKMTDVLKVAIDDILGSPTYTQRVKELSFIYHDRPVSPGAELVHWVEHVVKTRGALHLRSPALHVPWYQKTYLDLLAIILVALIIVTAMLKRVLSTIKLKICVDKKKKYN